MKIFKSNLPILNTLELGAGAGLTRDVDIVAKSGCYIPDRVELVDATRTCTHSHDKDTATVTDGPEGMDYGIAGNAVQGALPTISTQEGRILFEEHFERTIIIEDASEQFLFVAAKIYHQSGIGGALVKSFPPEVLQYHSQSHPAAHRGTSPFTATIGASASRETSPIRDPSEARTDGSTSYGTSSLTPPTLFSVPPSLKVPRAVRKESPQQQQHQRKFSLSRYSLDDEEISWIAPPAGQPATAEPSSADAQQNQTALIMNIIGGDSGEVVLPMFSTDAEIHSRLHEAEDRFALVVAVSKQNVEACVEHECLLREAIVGEYDSSVESFELLGTALVDMLHIWRQGIITLDLDTQLVRLGFEMESARLRIESEAFSCRLRECCDPEPSGADSSWRTIACPCYTLDVEVRHLSGIHLPPEPKQTCVLVAVCQSEYPRLQQSLMDEYLAEVTLWKGILDASFMAEYCMERLKREEGKAFARLVNYEHQEVIRAAAEERWFALAAAVERNEVVTSDDEARLRAAYQQRIKPMTFALFNRLQELCALEGYTRQIMATTEYWRDAVSSILDLETITRSAIVENAFCAGSLKIFEAMCLEGIVLAHTGLERDSWEKLCILEREARVVVHQREDASRRVATAALIAETIPEVELWERKRRNQLSLYEGQIRLEQSSLSRNVLREMLHQQASLDGLGATHSFFADDSDMIALTHALQSVFLQESKFRTFIAVDENSESTNLISIPLQLYQAALRQTLDMYAAEQDEREQVVQFRAESAARLQVMEEEAQARVFFGIYLREPFTASLRQYRNSIAPTAAQRDSAERSPSHPSALFVMQCISNLRGFCAMDDIRMMLGELL